MDSRVDDQTRMEQLIGEAEAKAPTAHEQRFVRQFFADVPPAEFLGVGAETAWALAQDFWAFAASRRPGELKIRLRNPDAQPDMADGAGNHSVIDIINDDMPFLVDSVSAEIHRQGLTVHLVIHPIMHVGRDDSGVLQAFDDPGASAEDMKAESWMRFEIDQQPDDDALAEIEAGIRRALGDVRAAVEDWREMLARVHDVVDGLTVAPPALPQEDIDEAKSLLNWLAGDNFTFLGYREYTITGTGDDAVMSVAAESGLGVLRNPEFHVFEGMRAVGHLPPDVRDFLARPSLLIVNKANARSTVHRPVHLDSIGVKLFDSAGKVIGERLFVGLFTSGAYTGQPQNIPLVRLKIQRVIERASFPPASHNAKALTHILASYPRDELFQIEEDDLHRIALGILNLQERQRVALFTRYDAFQRFVTCLVYVPREGFSTDLRERITSILEQDFQGEVTAFYPHLSDDSVLARLHFIVKISPTAPRHEDIAGTERRLAETAHDWSDQLKQALLTVHTEADTLRLHKRYARSFNAAYRHGATPAMAVTDIGLLEDLRDTGGPQMHVYRPDGGAGGPFHVRLYSPRAPMTISDTLPVLENFGLRVLEEVPNIIEFDDGGRAWIHDFLVQPRSADADDGVARAGSFNEAFFRVWDGAMENDGLNALVLSAGLDWRGVVVIRAYARYLRQAGTPFSNLYLEQTLTGNPRLMALIMDLFLAHTAESGGVTDGILADIHAQLDKVTSLDEDRIIRRIVNLVQVTLRTNFRQTDAAGNPKEWLSFKFSSREIDELPLPRPLFEIWVYAPRVEGVHLRFGKVARGGLRWSDRREDFRTEVLGLVKAQVVKNAVIVPVGSKGGFVVKRPPVIGGREAFQAEGIECYKMFIRGMLDLTDNIDGDTIVPPPDFTRHDIDAYGDDPYLVVAADKGTATFSDIANEVSAEYGFWLDDAFASGGSVGYDHKKMGITARGAWEAVKRHFREIGKNIQEEPFTAVGVGDMGGDVFGNGMLLSKQIRLVGAFNHLHIFCDPAPDAAASWDERKRLFDEVKGWDAYDTSLISPGGGVFERSAKSITLSPEIKAAFAIEKDDLTPNQLIRHMLRAEVELMWFGGIGTYVKAKGETNADAGDRANDNVRINGRDLRAQVVGEGANLGMTQLGRIDYALAGGRLNTDSIDNSAGVDCSDHEVNIKILLRDAIARGELEPGARNQLLEEMTDEVAELVLRDNYLQTQAITVTECLGWRVADRLNRFMRALERRDMLNRAVEFLPDDETLAERVQNNVGFTRPEISVLMSYAKIDLFDQLMASDLPDDPWLAEDLVRYFPGPIQERFPEAIDRHRLRREIIATFATNSVINRAGISFAHDLAEETGRSAADIVRAFLMARQALAARDRWETIGQMDNKLPAEAQTTTLLNMGRMLKRTTNWFLQHADAPLDVGAAVATYVPGVEAFRANREEILTRGQCSDWRERRGAYEAEGWPDSMSARMADAPLVISALDVVRLSGDLDRPLPALGRVYFGLGYRLGLEWLREQAIALRPEAYWDKLAVAAIVDDLYGHQVAITRDALAGSAGSGVTPDTANGAAANTAGDAAANTDAHTAIIDSWCTSRGATLARATTMLEDLRAAPRLDIAMLAVANRQIRALAGG